MAGEESESVRFQVSQGVRTEFAYKTSSLVALNNNTLYDYNRLREACCIS